MNEIFNLNPGRYVVFDGSSKTFNNRELIKSWGGYFRKNQADWIIDYPCGLCIKQIRDAGLNIELDKTEEGG